MDPVTPAGAAPGDRAAAPPRVSVIIPTRNRSVMLRRAIDSVRAQTFTDLEILVADDGSDDDTSEVVRDLGDRRVRHLRFAHGGAPRARNAAFALSRGALVAYLDDDDEWLPQKLERQLQHLASAGQDVGLVHCGTDLVSSASGRTVHTFRPADRHYTPADLLRDIPFTTSNVLIRRDVLEVIGGFDPDLAGAQDRDLWIRIARRFRIAGVPEVLVRRFVHGRQISSSLPDKIRAKEQLLDKYRDDLRGLPRERAHHLWRLGVLRCVAGRVNPGRRALLAAIAARPSARAPWQDLLTTLWRPRACVEELTRRRISRIDGVPTYY